MIMHVSLGLSEWREMTEQRVIRQQSLDQFVLIFSFVLMYYYWSWKWDRWHLVLSCSKRSLDVLVLESCDDDEFGLMHPNSERWILLLLMLCYAVVVLHKYRWGMDEYAPSSKRRPWRVDKSIHRGLAILTLKSKSEQFRNILITPNQAREICLIDLIWFIYFKVCSHLWFQTKDHRKYAFTFGT